VRALFLFLMSSGAALACSGPGAADLSARAELLALLGHGLSGVAMVIATWLAVRRKVVGGPLGAGWFLVIAHPNLWSSATSGDCGRQLEISSLLFTALTVGVLAWSAFRPLKVDTPTASDA